MFESTVNNVNYVNVLDTNLNLKYIVGVVKYLCVLNELCRVPLTRFKVAGNYLNST